MIDLSSVELVRLVEGMEEPVAVRPERAGSAVLVLLDEPLVAGDTYILRGVGSCARPEYRYEVAEGTAPAPPLSLGAIEVSRVEARIWPGDVEARREVEVTLGPSAEVLVWGDLYEWAVAQTPDTGLGEWSPLSDRRVTLSVACAGPGDADRGLVTPETMGLRAHAAAIWAPESSIETPDLALTIDCEDEVFVDGPTGRQLSEEEVEAWRRGRMDAGVRPPRPPGADAGMDGEGPASSRACACRAAGQTAAGSRAGVILALGLAGALLARRRRSWRVARA